MANVYRGYDNPDHELNLGRRVRVEDKSGTVYEGEVIRCGNTRTWGHLRDDRTGERIEFTIHDPGFEFVDL